MTSKLDQALRAVVNGYSYTPGDADLDDEQPIHVSITLGDYRRIRHEVRDVLPPSVYESCAKCGTRVPGWNAVIDHGTGPEAGRVFFYCSERCRETH